ncbi:hypothetical protein ACHAXA_000265 [Cyclostephanos tholiformis]|uniref:purine-nucleoside phosphorylase n=1 Tax=Cyclostephanos tholiformis TaxID=382380 RepID=A0ABD3SB56_9STRA
MISPTPTTTPSRLDPTHVPYRHAASYILSELRSKSIPTPVIGIICGSGLSGLSDGFDPNSPSITIPYSSIPSFPRHCTVVGHAGELVVGTLNSLPAICFRGRFHSYEGHDMNTVVLPVRTMRCLGVKLVLVTNAAGGLRDEYDVGDVAVIRDHVAIPLLAGKNPLVGMNDDELGMRFPPTSDLYDERLQDIVMDASEILGYRDFLRLNATYAFVSGPQYESKAECAMLRILGVDVVGMSTIPEVVAAHHAGMAVVCLSLITNKVVFADASTEGGEEAEASGDGDGGGQQHAHHDEVLRAVSGRSEQLIKLVGEVVRRIGDAYLPTLADMAPINLETGGRVIGLEEGGGEGTREMRKKERGCSILNLMTPPIVPTHCVVMGGVILAAGVLLGTRMGKRS